MYYYKIYLTTPLSSVFLEKLKHLEVQSSWKAKVSLWMLLLRGGMQKFISVINEMNGISVRFG